MNTANIITLIGIILGSNWLGSLLIEVYKNKRKRKTPMEKMVLSIGRDRLNFLCKQYSQMGGIPTDERQCFIKIGEAYLDMGGNTDVKDRFEQAKNLPIIYDSEVD